jgi:hypothetical protein
VLIAIVKKELHLPASLYTLLQVLSVSIFEKTPLLQAFSRTDSTTTESVTLNKLNLFNY